MNESDNAAYNELFPRLGISYEALMELYDNELVLENYTTADVCFKVIVPITKASSCSYAEYLKQSKKVNKDGSNQWGMANAFISHAWSFNFKTVMASLKQQVEKLSTTDRSGIYFWMDIVTVNQNLGAHHGQSNGIVQAKHFWNFAFTNAIASMSRVYFMFDSWESPYNVKRVWCLWEIMSFISMNNKVEGVLCLPEAEKEKIVQVLENEPERIRELYNGIDCKNAQASVESDRIAILEFLEKSIGFGRVNSCVKSWLREWLLETLDELVRKVSPKLATLTKDNSRQILNLYEGFAWLLEILGQLDRSIEIYKTCVDLNKKVYGETEPLRVLTSQVNLSQALMKIAKYSEALELLKVCSKVAREQDKNKPGVLGSTLNSLAAAYSYCGNEEECLKCYRETVSTGEESLSYATDEEKKEVKGIIFIAKRYLVQQKGLVGESAIPDLQSLVNESIEEFGEDNDGTKRLQFLLSSAEMVRISHLRAVSPADREIGMVNFKSMLEVLKYFIDKSSYAPLEFRSTNNRNFQLLCSDSTAYSLKRFNIGTSDLLEALRIVYKQVVQAEVIALQTLGYNIPLVTDGVFDLSNVPAAIKRHLADIHFSYAFFLQHVTVETNTCTQSDVDNVLIVLEKLVAIDPNYYRRPIHVQSMLQKCHKANGDMTEANEAGNKYANFLLESIEKTQINSSKRAEIYAAMLILIELERFEDATKIADVALKMDAKLESLKVNERSADDQMIIRFRNQIAYNPSWLYYQYSIALKGAKRLKLAIAAGETARLELKDNPFVELHLVRTKAEAGNSLEDVGKHYKSLLERFGSGDDAIGSVCVNEWLRYIQQKQYQNATKKNTNKKSGVFLKKEDIEQVLVASTVGNVQNEYFKSEEMSLAQQRLYMLAILRLSVLDACTALNEEIRDEKGTVFANATATTAWIENEMNQLWEEGNGKSSVGKVDHDIAVALYSDLNDVRSALHYWERCFRELNRQSHRHNKLTSFCFSPKTLYYFASAIFQDKKEDGAKQIAMVLIRGLSHWENDRSQTHDDPDLVSCVTLCAQMNHKFLEDYEQVVHWIEWLLEVDPIIEEKVTVVSDNWVNLRLAYMMLDSLTRLGRNERILQLYDIVRVHPHFASVLDLYNSVKKIAEANINGESVADADDSEDSVDGQMEDVPEETVSNEKVDHSAKKTDDETDSTKVETTIGKNNKNVGKVPNENPKTKTKAPVAKKSGTGKKKQKCVVQ